MTFRRTAVGLAVAVTQGLAFVHLAVPRTLLLAPSSCSPSRAHNYGPSSSRQSLCASSDAQSRPIGTIEIKKAGEAMLARTSILIVERLYLGAGLAIVARMVALVVNEMAHSSGASSVVEVFKAMRAPFIADYCVLFGLALLLVNFYVTDGGGRLLQFLPKGILQTALQICSTLVPLIRKISGTKVLQNRSFVANRGRICCDFCQKEFYRKLLYRCPPPASSSDNIKTYYSRGELVEGETAAREAKRFRVLVCFKVITEIVGVALATCLCAQPAGSSATGLSGLAFGVGGTAAGGASGVGVALALVGHAIFQAANRVIVSRQGTVTWMDRGLATKIMVADLLLATTALVSGMQMGLLSVASAFLMLLVGIAAAGSSRHGLVTTPLTK